MAVHGPQMEEVRREGPVAGEQAAGSTPVDIGASAGRLLLQGGDSPLGIGHRGVMLFTPPHLLQQGDELAGAALEELFFGLFPFQAFFE